jgi:hypothetical protein
MTSGKLKLRAALSGLTVLGTLAAMSVGAAFAGPAGAAVTSHHSTAVKYFVASRAENASNNCPLADFCAYSGINYTGNYEFFTGDASQWDSGVINLDESLINNFNDNDWVRLYYGPNYGNPHTCINPGYTGEGDEGDDGLTYFPNLLSPKYYFNSNTSGSRKYLWLDIHGSTMGSGACTATLYEEYGPQ